MAKQLNVDMNIRANTNQAQTELKKLQQTLNEAINGAVQKSGNVPLTKEISEATQAAAKLKVALAEATNVNTGKLDLSKFSESLTRSKTSLKEYSNQLLNLGPSGEKAFMQLANAVSSAEMPLRRSNGLLTNLWTTMKNTARWQLSSSAIKGFTGAISGAYHYAQNLNESLNNIRIVTGQNTEQMAKFATKANKAAQSLSTTTTAYTDAALIYYQQGLSDEAVQKRTETTIKLANVSRQNAEEVSSQMTAIWNNFAKGSENLEYYADVITALGASTASSSSEIAEGLSKFAAVADTVGLSYEKASAALATVVAETRQSADVVGTAFKTIFARMEGLNLGETLEDGTTLNKYSEALEKVGINIKDQSGQLKNMDTILNNIGEKWETLNKDQQIALAQTVAGVRQYTQFIALMDNYDKVQKNQGIAANSSGTVQKQADIYAESWEASSKRVKAAAQGLYDQLLNDDFFINFNNLLTGLINGISKFTKTLGGVPGLLGLLGTIATTVFKDQIAQSINDAIYSLSRFAGIAEDQAKQRRQEMKEVLLSISNPGETSAVQQAENKLMSENFELNDLLAEKKEKLLKTDYEELKILTEITQQYGEYAVNAAKAVEAAEEKTMSTRKKLGNKWADNEVKQAGSEGEAKSRAADARIDATMAFNSIDDSMDQILNSDSMQMATQGIKELQDALNNNTIDNNTIEGFEKIFTTLVDKGEMVPSVSAKVDEALNSQKIAFKENKVVQEEYLKVQKEVEEANKDYAKAYKNRENDVTGFALALSRLRKLQEKETAAKKEAVKASNKLQKAEEKVHNAVKSLTKEQLQKIKVSNNAEQVGDQIIAQLLKEGTILEDDVDIIRQYIKEKLELVDAENQAGQANKNYNQRLEETKEAIKKAQSAMISSFGQGLTTTFRGISQLSMGISSLKGMFDALNNTDMSFGEKFLSVATSLGMAIPSLIGGVKSLSDGLSIVKDGFLSGAKAIALHLGVAKADIEAEEGLSLAKIATAINTRLSKGATDSETQSKGASTAATILQKIANWGLLASMPPLLAITLVFTAALLALAAIVLAVVAGVNAISEAYNADAIAAEKAEKSAKELTETYEECKNKYEELKQAIENYQNAFNALNALAQGTREWKEQLAEANAKAMELINTYNLLQGKDYTIENGVITFQDGNLENLLNEENNKVNLAQSASIIANAKAAEARTKSNKTDLMRSESGLNTKDFISFMILTGPLVGAINELTAESQQKNISSAVDALTQGALGEKFKNNELSDQQLKQIFADALQFDVDDDLLKSIKDLATEINSNTDAMKAANQLAAEAILKDNKDVQGSKNKDQLIAASGRIYEKEEKKIYDNYFEKLSNSDSAKLYLSKIGKTYDHDSVSIDGDTIKYKVDGNEETISKEAVATSLATADMAEVLSEKLKNLDIIITQLNNSGQKAAISFASVGDFLTTTNAEFEKLISKDQANLQFDENGKLTSNVEDYLANTYGNGSLEEAADTLGYQTAEALVLAFTNKAEEAYKAWENIVNTLGEENTSLITDFEKLSIGAEQNIVNTFKSIAAGSAGKTGAQQYLKDLNEMVSGLTGANRIKALEQLSNIDWSNYNAIDKAKTIMEQYGITIDTASKKWVDLTARMRKANNAIPNLSELKENLTSISKILGKINFGDTVSDDDYAKLMKYGDAWKQFFMMQADGTYKFIGNAEQMKKNTEDLIQDAKEQLAARKEAQDKLHNDSSINSIDWGDNALSASQGKAIGNLSENLNNSNVRNALQTLGYDTKRINEIIANYNQLLSAPPNSINKEQAEQTKTDMSRMLNLLNDLNLENINVSEADEQIASLATNLDQLSSMYQKAQINAEAYDKQLSVLAMSVKSLNELKDLQLNGLLVDKDGKTHKLDAEEYSYALINLANNYDNCKNEILEYQKALASGSSELAGQTQTILENAIAVGEMSKALDLEADKVEEQAKELASANDLTKEQYTIASKVAILNQSMNKGVATLVENWSDYKKVLKASEKGTEDYAEAALNTKKALAQLLGVLDEDYIPADFLEIPGVMDLIDKAVEGDEKAINSLGTIMAKATIEALKFSDGLEDLNKKLTADEFEEYKNQVLDGITNLTESIQNGTIQAGENVADVVDGMGESWIEALNKMAMATGMSVDEMNSLLNELGVQTEVITKTKEVTTQVPEYTTYEIDNPEGDSNVDELNNQTEGGGWKAKKRSVTVQTGTKTVKGTIDVAQINTGENTGTPPTFTYAGRDNVSSSALTKSSGSGSSSKKNTSAASHTHEVHRYSNEENAIKSLSDQYARLNKAKDQAFGMGRVHVMELELKQLKELKKASSNYLDAIAGQGKAGEIAKAIYSGKNIGSMISSGQLGGTIRADYNSLYGGLSASGKGVEYSAKDKEGNEWLASDNYSLANFNALFGTNLQFILDSYGKLENRDSILNLLQNLKNSESSAYASVADPTAGSTTEYNKRIAYLDEVKERIEQYDSTADLLAEKTDEYLDYISSIQEKNAEIISTKMETGVNLGQKTIQRLERAIKVLGDNIYKTAEAMQAWFDATFKEGVEADKKQGDSTIRAIEEVSQKVQLYEQNPLDENAISPSDAADILSSAEDTLDNVIDSLLQRVEDGKEYFGNVLDYWENKMDNINQSIENNIKILSHLQNILSLLGREADYEALGEILQGQYDTALADYNSKKAQAEVAKNAYEKTLRDRESLLNQGASAEALAAYDENVLQKALENYQVKTDVMYSALEATMEAYNQLFENEMNKIFQESERQLSGEWGNFSDLDAAMERQKSIADEYLTKTNQIYETNTLLRKLSQDIDKTDSRISKEKLKNFALEIEAMKTKEKLSKSDLDIAKARYELLQAQLALEEARNAKTTVRLQRDNEGNYGYVYTADQNTVSNAEQNVADKENDLYNLLLKQSEDYGQKSIQIREEYVAQMQALNEAYYVKGTIDHDEFIKKQAEINEEYRELEKAYQESYQTANLWLNKVGAEGQTEAWVNSFDEIITEHRLFNNDSENELNEYNQEVTSIAEDLTNRINDKMSELNSQREYFTEEAKMDNQGLKDTVNQVTSSVQNLSNSVTRNGGLADSMQAAINKAQNLTTAFFNQYDALRDLIQGYSDAADRANNLYNRTVDLINVQVALNHAQNGATSVTWGSGGASAVYSDNNNYNNTSNGIKDVTPNTTESSNNKQRYAVHDYITGKDIIVTEDEIDQYRLKGAGPSRFLIKKISSYGTPGHFKSGGYTGTWASGKTGLYTGSWNGPDIEENGKLAFLHQKELVLNANDTENMLSAVKLIRQISQSIDLQALSQAQGLSVQAAQFSAGGQTLQQEVTIHAEFPNVSDHNEIEEALSNLVNRAAQFASRQ